MNAPAEPPSPGSPTAHTQGCLCPREINADGAGFLGDAEGHTVYVMHAGCPLHGWDES